jgi:hypothetical protein
MFNMFFPGAFMSLWDFMVQEERFIFIAYCVNYMLVESLYAAMGFGVYINSRVETEGWDLQLLFQQFEKAGTGENSSFSGAPGVLHSNKILLSLILCLFLFSQVPANAEDFSVSPAGEEETEESIEEPMEFFPEPFLPDEAIPREALDEVLASPDFGYSKPGWSIRVKDGKEPELNTRETSEDLLAEFEKIKKFLGFALRIFVCLAIGGFAAFVLYRLYRRRDGFDSGKGRGKGRVNYRNPLFSPESPEALFNKAAEFFASGNIREAWAACLKGSIAAYSQYGDISFPSGATEYGCLALVRSSYSGDAGGFGELVTNWIYLAYAGRNPPEGSFEKSLGFGRALETTLGSRPSGEPGESGEKEGDGDA